MRTKRCTVAYATPARQWLWEVELPEEGDVGEVLRLAREQAGDVDVPWDAETGIFGEVCARAVIPRDGDRIEIYRPLRWDPKESRRARAKVVKAAAAPAAAHRRTPNRKPAR